MGTKKTLRAKLMDKLLDNVDQPGFRPNAPIFPNVFPSGSGNEERCLINRIATSVFPEPCRSCDLLAHQLFEVAEA